MKHLFNLLSLAAQTVCAQTAIKTMKEGKGKTKGKMQQGYSSSPPTESPKNDTDGRTLKNDKYPFGPNRDKVTTHFCQVCRNSRIPRKNNIMNFLYLGTGTCMDYWINGQMSRLPTHMCSVIQYYAYHTCGCEIEAPNPILMQLADHLKEREVVRPRGVPSLKGEEEAPPFVPGHLLDLIISYDETNNTLAADGEFCLNHN